MSKKNKAVAGKKATKDKRFILLKDEKTRAKVKPWLALACCVVGLASAYVAMGSGHPVLASFCCYGGLTAGVVVYVSM